MVAVQGVETQVVLLVVPSLPNLCVFNDGKFDRVPQCHCQAAVLSQPQVHTGGEIKKVIVLFLFTGTMWSKVKMYLSM